MRDNSATSSGFSGVEPDVDPLLASQHLDLDALSAYLDGQLPPGDQAAARRHLAGCADCAREVAELRATVALLHTLTQYEPRRSYQLGPEYRRRGPGAARSPWAWLDRLVPALPALRVATLAVAVLLVVAVAGDAMTSGLPGLAPVGQPMVQAPLPAANNAAAPQAPGGSASDTSDEPEAAREETADAGVVRRAAVPAPTAFPPAAAILTDDEASDSFAQPEAASEQEMADAPLAAVPPAMVQPTTTAGPVLGAVQTVPVESGATEAGRAVVDAMPPSGASDGTETVLEASVTSATGARDAAAPETTAWRLAAVALGVVLMWLLILLAAIATRRRRRPA